MTNEEALKELKERVECADWAKETYCDSVSVDAVRIGIDAIEKQIPKRVEYKEIFSYLRNEKIVSPLCPICRNIYWGTPSYGCYYCDNCGQRWDWGDKNECNEQSDHHA